jgi:hypothetical protein
MLVGVSEGIAPPSLTSALDGGEWSAARPCRFNSREIVPRRLGESQSRSGRYEEKKNIFPLQAFELQFLGRPAHSLVNYTD